VENANFVSTRTAIVRHKTKTPLSILNIISDEISEINLIRDTYLNYFDIDWDKITVSEKFEEDIQKDSFRKIDKDEMQEKIKSKKATLYKFLRKNSTIKLFSQFKRSVKRLIYGFTLFDITQETAKDNFTDFTINEIMESVKQDIEQKIERHTSLKPKWEKINQSIDDIQISVGDIKLYNNKEIIEEVIFNLICNTIEHAFSETFTDVKININVSDNENETIIKYSNNGVPIECDPIDSIFDKTYTTKENKDDKSGEGLHGCQFLIEKILDGKINVSCQKNNDNERVLFTIKLNKYI
jgi:signal transduction histidine kinase